MKKILLTLALLLVYYCTNNPKYTPIDLSGGSIVEPEYIRSLKDNVPSSIGLYKDIIVVGVTVDDGINQVTIKQCLRHQAEY